MSFAKQIYIMLISLFLSWMQLFKASLSIVTNFLLWWLICLTIKKGNL